MGERAGIEPQINAREVGADYGSRSGAIPALLELFPGWIFEPWNARRLDEPAVVSVPGLPDRDLVRQALGRPEIGVTCALPVLSGADERPAFERDRNRERRFGIPRELFVVGSEPVELIHRRQPVALTPCLGEQDAPPIAHDRQGRAALCDLDDGLWVGRVPAKIEVTLPAPDPKPRTH